MKNIENIKQKSGDRFQKFESLPHILLLQILFSFAHYHFLQLLSGHFWGPPLIFIFFLWSHSNSSSLSSGVTSVFFLWNGFSALLCSGSSSSGCHTHNSWMQSHVLTTAIHYLPGSALSCTLRLLKWFQNTSCLAACKSDLCVIVNLFFNRWVRVEIDSLFPEGTLLQHLFPQVKFIMSQHTRSKYVDTNALHWSAVPLGWCLRSVYRLRCTRNPRQTGFQACRRGSCKLKKKTGVLFN